MSLYSDLHEVLTPYAQRIKGLSAANEEIKADLGTIVGGNDTTEALTFTTGKYINTGGSGVNIGDTIDVSNPSTYNLLKYAIAECSEGDKFLLNVKGAASGRAWAFLTSANVLISRADASATLRDFYITAPANAGKIVINDNFEQGTTGGTAYKVIAGAGKGAVVRFDTAQNLTDSEKAQARENIGVGMTDGLSDEVKEAILDCFRNVAWLDGTNGEESFNALLEALNASDASDFYNTWEWTYPGNLYMYNGTPSYLDGSSTDGVWLENSATSARIKRTMFTNKGKLAAVERVAIPGDVFPIPIPSGATSVSATINPSTMQVLLQRWVLQGDVYKFDSMTSWDTGTVTMNFSSAPDTFLCVNIRYNSNASVFQTEPQGFVITFE